MRASGEIQYADDPEGLLRRRWDGALSGAPLIVTAHLDARLFTALDALRSRHFPAGLNKVPAHVSLFHHLPGEQERGIIETVQTACAAQAPCALVADRWISLGRGVAARYRCAELDALHRRLSQIWTHWLTPQDRQAFRPHVTIQNKATAAEADALLVRIQQRSPPEGSVEGLSIWRYLGGPWQKVADCFFARPLSRA